MTRRSYSHRQGVVFCADKPMTMALAKETLVQHRKGAACMGSGPVARQVSAKVADDLQHAIGAAELFKRHAAEPARRKALKASNPNREAA